jgi:hypothetical protein
MPSPVGRARLLAGTLDGFASAVRDVRGLAVGELPAITHLRVQTENTLYRLVVLAPGDSDVLVEGGRFFPVKTRARLEGSSFGGALLKLAWLGVGLRMELRCEGQRIVTSPVRWFEILNDAGVTH